MGQTLRRSRRLGSGSGFGQGFRLRETATADESRREDDEAWRIAIEYRSYGESAAQNM